MKKLNQKGFGMIEGLLILVAVLLLGFGGYYVWNQNQGDEAEAVQTEGSSNEETVRTEEKPAIPDGWQIAAIGGYDIALPEQWEKSELLGANEVTHSVGITGMEIEYSTSLEVWKVTSNPFGEYSVGDSYDVDDISNNSSVKMFNLSGGGVAGGWLKYMFVVGAEAITVTSPLFGGEDPSLREYRVDEAKNDWEKFFANLPFDAEPGVWGS